MKIKKGVSVKGIRPEILLGLEIANGILPAQGQEVVITSCTDSKHGRGSLHYVGLAVDLRIWDLTDPASTVLTLQEALGDEYDVVLEGDHIHMEYQPK